MGEQILIVEDDKVFLEMMQFKLENKGYQVKKALDGLEALNVVERNKIDLIISDIILPNISGLCFLSVFNEFNFDKIPVIVISSVDKANIILSAIELGVYDYIVKPVDFEELCKKISLLLHKKDI